MEERSFQAKVLVAVFGFIGLTAPFSFITVNGSLFNVVAFLIIPVFISTYYLPNSVLPISKNSGVPKHLRNIISCFIITLFVPGWVLLFNELLPFQKDIEIKGEIIKKIDSRRGRTTLEIMTSDGEIIRMGIDQRTDLKNHVGNEFSILMKRGGLGIIYRRASLLED